MNNGSPSTAKISVEIVAHPVEVQTTAAPAKAPRVDFAFPGFREIPLKKANLIYSPMSAAFAMAMLDAGARGDTRKQIEAVLGGSSKDFSALYKQIVAEASGSVGELTLAVANSAWFNGGFSPKPAYLDEVEKGFGAKIGTVGFF